MNNMQARYEYSRNVFGMAAVGRSWHELDRKQALGCGKQVLISNHRLKGYSALKISQRT